MARGRIKQEPGFSSTANDSVDVLPYTPNAAINEVGRALKSSKSIPMAARARSSTFAPVTEPSERRGVRSGAPSIDTRPQIPVVEEAGEDEDEDECVLMEVRRRVKTLPEEDVINPIPVNQNMSFMSNAGFQAIGQQLKEVNDTLGTLQSLGIQHVASLPELVLVGDQSAGKSSIMSAIAGLNLPHNTGVCTRCPVHIRLSRAIGSEWTCRISLQQDYAFVPGDEPINQDDVTPDNLFPPWVSQPRVVKDFVTIREKVDSIEQVLRWAQVAILNHDDNHEQFIPKDLDHEDASAILSTAESQTKAKFSPNTVALEIRGPGLPDLSFYDLPGVFANARRAEDQYLAEVVLNLTREYISHSGAIILWAVPMNTDPENSTTFRVIREMNAVKRCLGVMTKADLLPSGGHDQWIAILEGRFHQTGLGYFITSRPDKGDLDNQTAWEEAFFNRRVRHSSYETPTWPQEFAAYDKICGVVRLKDFLSHKLAEDFRKSLPAVKAKLQERLHDVVGKLKKLPELPENPEFEMRKALLEFTNLARSCLDGPDFLDAWKAKESEFRDTVVKMKPKYIVKPPATSNVIDLEADTPTAGLGSTPKRPSGADHYTHTDMQNTPSKRRLGTVTPGRVKDEDNSPMSTPRGWYGSVTTPAGLRPSGFPPRSRTLEELRAIIQSKRQPGVPDSIPESVYQYLCTESVQPWIRPVTAFMKETSKLVNAELHKALEAAFAVLKKRTVYREARTYLDAFLKSHRETLANQLNYALTLERRRMYTKNDAFFAINKEAELRELKRHRHFYRWAAMSPQAGEVQRPRPLKEMSEEEIQLEQARMAKEAPKLGPDLFKQEIEVASYIRGYYLTAASRFIDYVSLHMLSGMFPMVAESIQHYLDKKLGLMDQADRALFDRLMEEEAATADKRAQLKSDRNKFDKAMESILALEASVSARTARNADGAEEYEDLDIDEDVEMTPGSPLGQSAYQPTLATGEVI